MAKEINNSFLTGCLVLDALIGHEFDGITNAEIAKSLDMKAPIVLRNLATLEQLGWAVQDAQKRWRVSPVFAQQAHKINNSISSAVNRVEELAKRYSQ